MDDHYIFKFKTDISKISIPEVLNNPFGSHVPEIGVVAAREFQEFISVECHGWDYDFSIRNGKMFGVLVVQRKDNSYAYLGTVSGKLPGDTTSSKLTPSVFDDSTDDFFFNKGMTELTVIGTKINNSSDPSEVATLTKTRSLKSVGLQKWLFENYQFLDPSGNVKNVIQIFEDSSHGNPPSAAGECAAPKLLQQAYKYQLRPIALAEFWWGIPLKGKEREHKVFYPACKAKCRPILEYMLGDITLFNNANPATSMS